MVWWFPPLLSSFLGSIIDTFVFFYIAFSDSLDFIEPNNDVSWANDNIPLLNIFDLMLLFGLVWLLQIFF